MKWRWYIAFAIPLVLFGALFFKMYTLQIEDGAVRSARAAANDGGAFSARRGSIYFTDKYEKRIPAAIEREFPTIFAIPKEIQNPTETAKAVAELLGLTPSALEKSFRKANDEYELLIEKATKEEVEKVKAAKLPGLHIGSVNSRFYPLGNLAAHLLGFVGRVESDDEAKGRYGIELYFDDALSGVKRKSGDGEDIELTIDRDVQARAEEILKQAVIQHGAERGTVIVENPQTGAILAMGNYPTFDPNNFSASPVNTFLNFAVQGIYEPGSIFKVITMGAGLDSGAVTPETTFYDAGSLTLNQHTIRNWDLKAHGDVTMTEVIEQSINTGAAFVARTMGLDQFLKYVTRFGVEAPTGITIPGELKGSVKSLKQNKREINLATAAFGQGVAVTPIRLIAMISAIANKGVMMQPSILLRDAPRAAGRVISEESAKEVTQMMVSAVEKAKVAYIPHYRIAGKTGTAQIPNFKKGGYSNEFIHTYSGFAPADNPRFVILFKLEKPTAELAGTTVVPAFRELAQFLLDYYSVPPSIENVP